MSRSENRQGWEESEFPILCETCLGPNPYVRMTKQSHGNECKICSRPFTVFRWNPGNGMRYKKTEICQVCAKLKNVCQTCIFDLEYGLPVEVRDKALNIGDNVPNDSVNRAFVAQNAERVIAQNEQSGVFDHGKATSAGRELLRRMARTEPYYNRNRAHLCSFFAKGECRRGKECPYRHEMPEQNELSSQNMRDRYYGKNDPVARKIMGKAKGFMSSLAPPDDQTITSLFVSGVEDSITEEELRNAFVLFGDIKSVVVARKVQCAFVNFALRNAAEQAAERYGGASLQIKGHTLRVAWGRPRPQGPQSETQRRTEDPTLHGSTRQ
ncbi:putative cell wall organization and biogenesis-related protein [Thamnocephalis sphaerospora]|uniref:Pre-mRNA-splicing factor SLT11 n=1 Tax=Thamnocephalis sphaerospora TaxID=78915 RepID=A0A4P9XW46_9FUNG|nr:putative cell wall organization and biogenesis-related protein [Thamnocephalis sphaerospora]|eukprot:RKP10518.1 putative cell wall organization and biogenesis-related protein [Thamnocephalis sphaerospora]